MNKSLENKLCESYSEILPKKWYPTGLPIDDGWYVILDTICHHIKTRINVVHWGYNHKEGGKMECEVCIVRIHRQDYGGRLTLEFGVSWTHSLPTEEVKTKLHERLKELTGLVETWSERTCEMSGRPGQNYVSIDDARVSRVLDPSVAKALNFVDESYHYKDE